MIAVVALDAIMVVGLVAAVTIGPPRLVSRSIVSGVIMVAAGTYRDYPFSYPSSAVNATMQGAFNATKVEVFIFSEANFVKWQSGDSFIAYYQSGYARYGIYVVDDLPPGRTYHLVFSDAFPNATGVSVLTNDSLSYVS